MKNVCSSSQLGVGKGLLPKLKKAQLFSDSLYGLRSYQKEGLGQISKILTNYVTPLYTLTLHTNVMFWNEPPCSRCLNGFLFLAHGLGAFNKVLPIAQLSKGNSLIKLMVILVIRLRTGLLRLAVVDKNILCGNGR